MDRNWAIYWKNWQNYTLFYQMVKINVKRNYTQLDDRGKSLYDTWGIDRPQTAFDASRIIFLYLFQTLVQYIPLKQEHMDLAKKKVLKASSVPYIPKFPPDLPSFDYA